MKRNRRDNNCDTTTPPPSTKRRRTYSDIEDGFSLLSINGNTAPLYHNIFVSPNTIRVEEIPAPAVVDTEMSSASALPSPSLLPAYIVEEPDIPEVNMKTSSWYEPEHDRIVITDLDSFTESDDEEEQSLAVNNALLRQIRANAVDNSALTPSTLSTSQALVLYRPLQWTTAIEGAKKEHGKNDQRMPREKTKKAWIEEEEDAMDIEP